jgi:hypothetical protein
LWEGEERQKLAQSIADKLAADIGPSSTLSSLETKDKRVSYAQLGPITRFGESPDQKHIVDTSRLSPEVLEKLFKAKEGDVFTAPVQNGVVVARVKDIVTATPTGAQLASEQQLLQSLKQDIGSNLVDQVTKSFTARFPATVDQKSLDTMTAAR